IRNYVQEFEDAIVEPNRTNPNTGRHYTEYIDRNAWVDHGLLNILAANVDGLRLSTFMHKPRGGKLIAGPIWDFDLTMNSRDARSADPLRWSANGFGSPHATDLLTWGWWKYLYADPDFWQRFVDRWSELREGPMSDASMSEIIATYHALLAEAAVRNYEKWNSQDVIPRDGPDADNVRTYLDEMDIMRTWLVQHTGWIDSQLVAKPARSPAGGPAGSVTVTAGTGTIYYTLDGSDPRLPGGNVNPAALTLVSGGSVTVSNGILLTARVKSGALWSAPSAGYYFTTPPAGPGAIVVSELNYHPGAPSPEELSAGLNDAEAFEFIELMNISNGTVDLGGSHFTA
ncbi:MAG: CotH kinase family protein, partial [Thermomicrobiales bacterium]